MQYDVNDLNLTMAMTTVDDNDASDDHKMTMTTRTMMLVMMIIRGQ